MRTAAKMMLLAGLGGGVSLAPAADPKPARKPTPLTNMPAPSAVEPAVGYSRVTGTGVVMPANGMTVTAMPVAGTTSTTVGMPIGSEPAVGGIVATGGNCADGSCGHGGHGFGHARLGHGGMGGGGFTQSPYGPQANGLQIGLGHAGIMPAPAMGPYGAVAAVGAFGPGAVGPMYSNQRSSIRFVSPAGMRVTWQTAPGVFTDGTPLEAPARYNFPQGNVYRLKLTNIANRPGLTLYPTLEVYPATPRTITFLSHAVVPVGFSDEDLDQVRSGNLVVKVIYLPNEAFQDAAVLGGADEVVSTRLEPGVDPIVEANRRGTILAVIRMGNIDLEDPNTPRMDGAPAGAPVPLKPVPPAPVPVPPVPVAPPVAAPVSFNGQTIPMLTPAKTPAGLPTAVKAAGGK